MTDKTISLKLTSELLQQAEEIAGDAEKLHDFLVSAIENEIERRQTSVRKIDFWQGLEQLKNKMQEEEIEIDSTKIWGDIRDKEPGREIILP